MADAPAKLAWVDIETTGLDPAKNAILEVALIITDSALEVLDERIWIVRPNLHGEALSRARLLDLMNDYVREMHGKSGLLEECLEGCEIRDVEGDMVEIMGKHFGPKRAHLAGSSVHFDHGFLSAHMPIFDRTLHYRHFDVSVLQRAFEMWRPDLRLNSESRDVAHRALDDIRWSIHVAREYRKLFATMGQSACSWPESNCRVLVEASQQHPLGKL